MDFTWPSCRKQLRTRLPSPSSGGEKFPAGAKQLSQIQQFAREDLCQRGSSSLLSEKQEGKAAPQGRAENVIPLWKNHYWGSKELQ